MKKNIPVLSLVLVYAVVATIVILNQSQEIAVLKTEIERMSSLSEGASVDSSSSYETSESHANPIESNQLADGDNELLKQELDELKQELEIARQGENELQGKLDELLKPLDEDILSSTIKTTVAAGEAIMTGGYQNVDGNFQFTMLEPAVVELNGQQYIQIAAKRYSMTPEVMAALGLDSLQTSAGNTLQHGEIWTRADIEDLLNRISGVKGIDLMTAPVLTVTPGKTAGITVGGYNITTTPHIAAGGAGVDIELRIEEPRDVNSADSGLLDVDTIAPGQSPISSGKL